MRPESTHNVVRFGVFEVDLACAELRKQGLRLRLQEQPFQILAALLEKPGEVVTREELARRLWQDGTVVDYDRGLNAAVTRLRQALSDSAETPRYIETVARRGYRFICSVEGSAHPILEPETPPAKKRNWFGPVVSAGSVLLAVAAWWAINRKPAETAQQVLNPVPITAEPGIEQAPSFSPDGNQIAYEWYRSPSDRHIYVKLIGPGDPIQLTQGPNEDFSPAWSPNGRFIAFLRHLENKTIGVFLVPALGGVARKIHEYPESVIFKIALQYRRLDWMPDSKHLIVSGPEKSSGSDGLFVLSTENGQTSWLTKPTANNPTSDLDAAVSPDGRTIAFARGVPEGANNVFLLQISKDLQPIAEPRLLTSEGRNPQWISGGLRLLIAHKGGLARIALEPGSEPRRILGITGSLIPFAVSSNGRLAYGIRSTDSNIWRQQIPPENGAAPPPIAIITSTATDMTPHYSPDGSQITFMSRRSGNSQIWICSNKGTSCSQFTTTIHDGITGSPRWSPDGKKIAFDSSISGNFDIYAMDVNGGTPQPLASSPALEAVPRWSQDGKYIYFSSTRSGSPQLWKVPSTGGDAIQITHLGGHAVLESADGRSIYYVKNPDNTQLWKSAFDGSGERPIIENVYGRSFVVTMDRIYYLQRQPDNTATLRYLNLANGQDRKISSIDKPILQGLSLSPDGKYLIYSQTDNYGGDLMFVPDFH